MARRQGQGPSQHGSESTQSPVMPHPTVPTASIVPPTQPQSQQQIQPQQGRIGATNLRNRRHSNEMETENNSDDNENDTTFNLENHIEKSQNNVNHIGVNFFLCVFFYCFYISLVCVLF